jgi:AraC-like DNA-binding protein
MLSEPLETDIRLWSTDVGLGLPTTWLFEGADGIARLDGPASFSAPDPAVFRAKLTRVQLDHVALEAFGATPHRYERTDGHVRQYPTPILTFVLVAEGRIRVETDGSAFDLESGECVIVDSRVPVSYSARTEVRMMRTVVGIEHIPRGLQRRGIRLTGPMERTALVDAYIAFVSSILRATAAGRPAEGVHLVRAVADLQVAVLAETQEATSRAEGLPTMRHRIEDHIDRHLADPDLGPLTIASALGISVRHAHGSFNEDEHTIARVIRERRLTAVATELQVVRETPDPEDLAIRYGFSGGASLQRAFRARYGVSLAAYHRDGHRQLD